MIDFVLPSLGADMDRAKLNTWLVGPGDTVRKGAIIAEVETEKAVLEVECWDEGKIEELLVHPGPEWLAVGTPLARIGPVEKTAVEKALPPTRTEAPATPISNPPGPRPPVRRHEPTPPIRHLAHELGVDLSMVRGTGPDGAISREDVRAATGAPREPQPVARLGLNRRVKASPRARFLAGRRGVDLSSVSATGPEGMVTAADVEAAPTAAAEPEDRFTVMRRAIARSMAHSNREIPHYYLATHIDLDRALRWLEAQNADRTVAKRIVPAAMLLKATALALRQTPELNGHWIDERFRPSPSIHLGVAVAIRGGGLVAPAIHDADQLGLDEMMGHLRDLVNRARSWRLRSSEMSDPTITVTNLGDRGVETALPVIIPPQVAMVGFGKIVDSVVAVDGSPVVHPVVHATLAGDHRVTDGHRGGLLLAAIDRLLQEPESL
jgi:pyruvate dehydrogenase E2 component (dihydrolipoamide acetyltransferase)